MLCCIGIYLSLAFSVFFSVGYAYECDALRDFIEEKIVECSEDCGCTPDTCKNRLIAQNPGGVVNSIKVAPTKTKGRVFGVLFRFHKLISKTNPSSMFL
jgi:hypothetical protein